MASSDVRDVLNLTDSAAPSGSRPSKKARIAAPRPNLKGLAREVYSLGGDNPIAIVPEVTQFKKRRLASRKPAARWEMRPFRNSGREDGEKGLILRHWRRVEEGRKAAPTQEDADQQQMANADDQEDGPKLEGEAETEQSKKKDEDDIEDSAFAKFNVHVPVPHYTEDQYQQSLQNKDWTREETDYLMELARDFDLRWPIIWDRYDWSPPATNGPSVEAGEEETKAIVPASRTRTMEDLKARYYEIAARMMAIQKPVQYMTQQEFALHELMAHFNPQQEKLRKEYATNTLSRSYEEAREEESLLLEIKRILARSEKFNDERRELYRRLDYPQGEHTDISAFKSSSGLQTLLQTLMTVDKTKKRKSLMGGDGVSPGPGQTGSQANGAAAAASQEGASRRDSTAPATGGRDGAPASATATPTAANNKKGGQASSNQTPSQQQAQERRKLTAQEEALYGIAHLDRSGSGPAFRTEKINKLFTHKSVTQQGKITNVLHELDVPARLAMPCASTTLAYEQLLAAVNTLLDARKVSDKLDAELKLEQAKKREREGPTPPPADGEAPKAEGDKTNDKGGEEAADDDTSVKQEGENAASAAATTAETKADAANSSSAPNGDADPPVDKDTEQNGDGDNDDGETAVADTHTSASAPHKRSASVLSTVSDKSAKRQKK
ncbi:SANT/Myb-like domain of DAMP1 domain-containing protein [Sarocladium implicatum]|nr:SANT/Myb-like domain of DAMP1 domain-containing protein [Sarocladium implicatum]